MHFFYESLSKSQCNGTQKKKKEKKKGFRIELHTKSDFESNARRKLRQTIYFFWP